MARLGYLSNQLISIQGSTRSPVVITESPVQVQIQADFTINTDEVNRRGLPEGEFQFRIRLYEEVTLGEDHVVRDWDIPDRPISDRVLISDALAAETLQRYGSEYYGAIWMYYVTPDSREQISYVETPILDLVYPF